MHMQFALTTLRMERPHTLRSHPDRLLAQLRPSSLREHLIRNQDRERRFLLLYLEKAS